MESRRGSTRSLEVWTKRVNGVATLALFGAVLGGAAVGGRKYRRWSKDTNLLTAPRATVERFRTDYRSKKASALEVGGLIGGMAVEIVAASGQATRRAVADAARRNQG